MADVLRKIISANAIRHGDTLASVDLFGNKQKIVNNTPNGYLGTIPSLPNRLAEYEQFNSYTTTLTLTSANTPYSWSVPEGTKKYAFKSRDEAADILFAFGSGHIAAGNYSTLPGGVAFENPNDFGPLSTDIIYMQSTTAAVVVEITYWL